MVKKQASLLHAAMDDWACALFVPPPAALSSHKAHKGIFFIDWAPELQLSPFQNL